MMKELEMRIDAIIAQTEVLEGLRNKTRNINSKINGLELEFNKLVEKFVIEKKRGIS